MASGEVTLGERICVGKLDACCDNAQVRGKAYITSQQVPSAMRLRWLLQSGFAQQGKDLINIWLSKCPRINHRMWSREGIAIPSGIQKGPSCNTKWGDEV